MRAISIRWNDLEIAFERNAPGVESYIDVRTGEVLTLQGNAPGMTELRARISAGLGNGAADAFVRIEPASSREQYRWMERFVGSVSDDGLRERLHMSIDGKGAFRRFKDVLLTFPGERERWFSYRADFLHWHIQEWLKRESLCGVEPPPWGVIERPPELEIVADRPPAHTEAPGEALRRQVRELCEQLPVLELPAAIAFLEFLRDRRSANGATTGQRPAVAGVDAPRAQTAFGRAEDEAG